MRKIVLVLLVALLGVPAASAREERVEADCAATSVGLSPLTDLGGGRYHGYRGGLYANGKNVPPKTYAKTGLARAKTVKPIDGKTVLLSIGMSNTTQEFSAFKRIADADARKNPALAIVDGAQGGQTRRSSRIRTPASGPSSSSDFEQQARPPRRCRRSG